MKHILILLFISALNHWAYSNQKIKSSLNQVTVYLAGAELKYEHQVKLKKGENKLVFSNLSSVMIPKSIHVSVSEGVEIVSVTEESDFLTVEKVDERTMALKDSLDLLKDRMELLGNEKEAYYQEKLFLEENKYIGGEETGVQLNELQTTSSYYLNRHFEINKKISSIEWQISKLEKERNNISNTLSEINYDPNSHRKNILITLSTNTDRDATISFRYLVRNAGWEPYYDILAKDVNTLLNIKYKAKAFNNSGIDWNDIHLTLSTADPFKETTQPELQPWYLSNIDEYNGYADTRHLGGSIGVSNSGWLNNQFNIPSDNDSYKVKERKQIPSFKAIEVNMLSMDFEIKRKYTIPSDAKPYQIAIKELDVPAIYEYTAVPKMESNAYLLAKIPDWEEINLIEGFAHIYFGNTYIGESYLATNTLDDTLALSLGPDKSIIITRESLKENRSKSILGNNIKETFAYEINIKNNKSAPVQIKLYDQVPVSQDSDIDVDVIKTSDAKYIENTGELNWNLNLAPGASSKVAFSFSYKYPKNQQISRNKVAYRKMSAPSF